MAKSQEQDEEPSLKRQELPAVLSSSTIRKPSFFYLCISLVSTTPHEQDIDELVVRTHLTSALNQFLGITGNAVSIDILKCEGMSAWIRVPREDGGMVIEALSGWASNNVAWHIKATGTWLGGLCAGDGRDLFD